MFLGEVDLALGAVHGPPLAHAPLQGAQHVAAVVAGVTPLQLFEQRDGIELGVSLQQRDDLSVPNAAQRVVAGAPGAFRRLRGQRGAGFDAPGAALADAGLGRRGDLGEGVAVVLVLVHLVVRDLLAGHVVGSRKLLESPQ